MDHLARPYAGWCPGDVDQMVSLPAAGFIEQWTPPRLELVGGKFIDYLHITYALGRNFVCSEKLRSILEKGASPADQIQWLPFHIYTRDEERIYYLLQFIDIPDQLDWEASLKYHSGVLKPIFSKAKLGKHRVFTYPTDREGHLYVVPEVKAAIEAADCRGVQFFAVTVR